MAEMQRENRGSEPRSRADVERTPQTQQEVKRPQQPAGRGELTRRGGLDEPFGIMNAFRREVDRLFDHFESGFGDLSRSVWSPQVEVYEREGKLHVRADLPGLDKDNVKVEVLDTNLTIEGERQSEQRDERVGWSERSYGSFFRSIPLPEGINPDTARASFENGVLDIAFDAPKLEQRRGKQIQIGSSGKK